MFDFWSIKNKFYKLYAFAFFFPKISLIIRNEKTNKKYMSHILYLTKEENFYLNKFFMNVHSIVCKLTLCFSMQVQKQTVNLYIYLFIHLSVFQFD